LSDVRTGTARFARAREKATATEIDAERRDPGPSTSELERLVDLSVDMLSITTLDGRFVVVNPAWSLTLGWAEGELRGRGAHELVHPDDRDRTRALVKSLTRPGTEVRDAEVRLRHKDGSWRWVTWSARSDGDRVYTIARDVTETRAAHKALRASEQRMRTLLENAQEGVWLIDADDRISFANARLADMFGYRIEEMVGRSMYDFLDAGGRKLARERMQARRAGLSDSQELRFTRRDGGELWVILSGGPLTDEDGNYAGTLALLVDITERRVREQALRASVERYRNILETTSEGVWMIDGDHHTTYVNRRMAEMLGTTVEGMLGRPVEEFLPNGQYVRAPRGMSVREVRLRRRDGSEMWGLLSGNPLSNGNGGYAGALAMTTDITDRKRAEEALTHQAFHDALTGLANRALFSDRVDQALRRSDRGDTSAAVVFIDLDGFKAVNDTLGHQAGDALLREVAERLRSAVRAGDTVARLGGDEFAVLVGCSGDGADEARTTADRVLDVLAHPVELAGQWVTISGSVGIAVAGEDATGESLVRDADIAMYAAKVSGRGRSVVFDPDMRAAAVERRRLEQELAGALAADQFRLVYQPVVDLADQRVLGFEALLRWQSPTLGAVPPNRFVPVAEDLGLIDEIGAWVLREACRTAAAWRREHPAAADTTMSVNVSAVQLTSPDLLYHVREALTASGLPASALVLEVTETALVSHPERAAESLSALRALGVRLALDDFGTGYSSFSYLQHFTVDVLKIDRSFVATITSDGEMPPIVRGLVDLGRALDLEVVAEGVESEAQRARLLDGRCVSGQGFLFAAPLEATDAELLLLGQRPGTPAAELPRA
jgi:diguanylate cyclase (GGDEF)-like protein/PAS domain S-box-containing protein